MTRPLLLAAALTFGGGSIASCQTTPMPMPASSPATSAGVAPKARPSPMAIAATTVNGTYAKVIYSQPFRRDRVIFGGEKPLVPYGEVWRTGANEATEITTTGPLTVAGKSLPAGTYSVFTMPGAAKWTVIFNRGLGEWGAYTYDMAKDALRVEVPVGQTDKPYEAFYMAFDSTGVNSRNLVLRWDRVKVAVPITFPAAGK